MHPMKQFINSTATGSALLSLFVGLGTVAVSSCCVLPLALSAVGLGGAWLGELSQLSFYQPYFLGAATVALTIGWVIALRRRMACTRTETCAQSKQNWLVFGLLGLSTLTVATAAGWN